MQAATRAALVVNVGPAADAIASYEAEVEGFPGTQFVLLIGAEHREQQVLDVFRCERGGAGLCKVAADSDDGGGVGYEEEVGCVAFAGKAEELFERPERCDRCFQNEELCSRPPGAA